MSDNSAPPSFDQFTRWAATKFRPLAPSTDRYELLLSAARAARNEVICAIEATYRDHPPDRSIERNIEVLQLLAAASADDATTPPELTTARGFRVTLAYDDGKGTEHSSICVLVHCPPEMLPYIQGEKAYLWSGSERFELGQFDADGKAIGTLPAGVQISLSDFAMGHIKLEEPPSRAGD
jgi:hypothetical protein